MQEINDPCEWCESTEDSPERPLGTWGDGPGNNPEMRGRGQLGNAHRRCWEDAKSLVPETYWEEENPTWWFGGGKLIKSSPPEFLREGLPEFNGAFKEI